MSIEITFVRHGETDANASSIWQGQGDARLSEVGRTQARSLEERLSAVDYDHVISSDLARTVETAELAGLDPVLDPVWREMDIGAWEGLTRDQVREQFPDQIERLAAGDLDVAMGGGETWREFGSRVAQAVDQLAEETEAGSRVLVMAHGGVIHAALSAGLGLEGRRPWPISRIVNTAISEVIIDDEGEFHLQTLNDARHAPVVTGNEQYAAIPVGLVRHGESEANVAGKWHGHTDGPLTDRGQRQGADLASQYDAVGHVYASPLQRTRHTAQAFVGDDDLEVSVAEDLIEIDFGAWEGLTIREIKERFPDEFERVFERGEDIARGGTGETFAGAGERMERQVREIAERHPADRVALFTHGGAIWALASRIMGIDWTGWRKLAIPSNVSTTHVRFDEGRPVLVDYNLSL